MGQNVTEKNPNSKSGAAERDTKGNTVQHQPLPESPGSQGSNLALETGGTCHKTLVWQGSASHTHLADLIFPSI